MTGFYARILRFSFESLSLLLSILFMILIKMWKIELLIFSSYVELLKTFKKSFYDNSNSLETLKHLF